MMTLLSSEQKDYAELLVKNYEQTRPDVYFLALITSPARKIEPELLRALRLKLADYFPAGAKPSVETESALWFSSLVESRGSDSITLLPGVLDLLRERLKAQPVNLLEKIRAIIKECHQSVPPVISWEEDLIYYSLIPAQDIHRRSLIRHTVLMAAKAVLSGKRPGLEEWINGMTTRVPAEISEHEDFKTLLLLSQTKIRRTKILSNARASSAASDDRILK
ncbi:MAG TPA: hypothetical protein VK400_14845, partial [Pyrinomonadaceae bacterium]|nr:hypothetical protein [Pyrinomonadaceae bacterium]